MHPAYRSTCRIWHGSVSVHCIYVARMERCCTVRVAYGLILHCTCRTWVDIALYASHMGYYCTVRVAYGLILHCTGAYGLAYYTVRVAYVLILHCTYRIWGGIALFCLVSLLPP